MALPWFSLSSLGYIYNIKDFIFKDSISKILSSKIYFQRFYFQRFYFQRFFLQRFNLQRFYFQRFYFQRFYYQRFYNQEIYPFSYGRRPDQIKKLKFIIIVQFNFIQGRQDIFYELLKYKIYKFIWVSAILDRNPTGWAQYFIN